MSQNTYPNGRDNDKRNLSSLNECGIIDFINLKIATLTKYLPRLGLDLGLRINKSDEG